MFKGSIPERIVYITKKPTKVTVCWQNLGTEYGIAEDVIPAFVSDADNKKTIETGLFWSARKDQTLTPIPNIPISGVKVVSVVSRQQNNCFKAMTSEGFYVDIRDDVLLEAIKTVGVKEGGILNGEFIWARVGSDMKLVRVGSSLHKAMTEVMENKSKKLISSKELVPGIYKLKNGNKAVYFGKVKSFSIKELKDGWEPSGIRRKNYVGSGPSEYELWFEEGHRVSIETLEDVINDKYFYYNLFSLKKSNSAISLINKIEITETVISKIREKVYSSVIEGKMWGFTFEYLCLFYSQMLTITTLPKFAIKQVVLDVFNHRAPEFMSTIPLTSEE
jgi:hypothetical protein